MVVAQALTQHFGKGHRIERLCSRLCAVLFLSAGLYPQVQHWGSVSLGTLLHAADGAVYTMEGDLRYADVGELQQVEKRSGKPEDQRLAEALNILRRELQDPSFPVMGLAGGPSDAGYVLGQGTFLLGLEISPERLQSARQQEGDPQVRELLAIALVYAGDTSLTEEARRLAREHPLGSIRSQAIHALYRQQDPANKEVFLSVLQDRFTSLSYGFEAEPGKLYVVRYFATVGLRMLGETPPADTVIKVPFPKPRSDAELYAHLLEDKAPDSCQSGVLLLSREGEPARPYLEAFVEANAGDPALQESVAIAQKALAVMGTAWGAKIQRAQNLTEDMALPTDAKVVGLIQLLREEIANPTDPPSRPAQPGGSSLGEGLQATCVYGLQVVTTPLDLANRAEALRASQDPVDQRLRKLLLTAMSRSWDMHPEKREEAQAARLAAIPELAAMLWNEEYDWMREQAAQGLHLLQATEALPLLLASFTDPSYRYVDAVDDVWSLGLPDTLPRVRLEAAMAFLGMGHAISHPVNGIWLVDDVSPILPALSPDMATGWRSRVAALKAATNGMEGYPWPAESEAQRVLEVLRAELASPLDQTGKAALLNGLSLGEYVQDICVDMAAELVEPRAILAWREAASAENEAALRTRLLFAFATAWSYRNEEWPDLAALRGEAITELTTLLHDDPDDFVRAMAARSLGQLRATEAREAVTAALQDPAARSVAGLDDFTWPGKPDEVHMVRRAASAALQHLDSALLDAARPG